MSKKSSEEPSVTLGLVTFNQKKFVEEAVLAALGQTHRSLEVVICDDASEDGTFELASSTVAATPTRHYVRLHQNRQRLGINNFNQLLSLSTGDLIVIAHGDDISSPARVERIVRAWLSSGSSMITSNAQEIDTEGNLLGDANLPGGMPDNSLVGIAANGWNPTLWGAVLAIHRDVFDVFGPLDPNQSVLTTDWILPFRAASINGIKYIDEKLVRIRRHPKQKSKLLDSGATQIEKVEQWASSELSQYLYMLDEFVRVVRPLRLQPPEVLEQTSAALSASILRSANIWRVARNKLNASRLGLDL